VSPQKRGVTGPPFGGFDNFEAASDWVGRVRCSVYSLPFLAVGLVLAFYSFVLPQEFR
jgi:hypothetical protein